MPPENIMDEERKMNKYTDKRGNVIYSYCHPRVLNIHINFQSFSGCSVYLAHGAYSMSYAQIDFFGNNATIFIGNAELGNSWITIDEAACLYIGNGTHFNPYARIQRIRCLGNQIIVIGKDNLFSENLEISTVDQHILYDINSLTRSNENKSIFIGDHVWVGRSATILKGSYLASGCVLGQKALTSGKLLSSNSCNVGIPAKTVAIHQLWSGECNYGRTPQEIARQVTLEEVSTEVKNACFSHDPAVVIRPCDIKKTLCSLSSSAEKIAFMYDVLHIKANHNRFAWSKEDASAINGKIIVYNADSFQKHVAQLHICKWINLPSFTKDEASAIKLFALWNRRFFIRWQYYRCSLLSAVFRGKKKTKYRSKKAHYRLLLKRISAFKQFFKYI